MKEIEESNENMRINGIALKKEWSIKILNFQCEKHRALRNRRQEYRIRRKMALKF